MTITEDNYGGLLFQERVSQEFLFDIFSSTGKNYQLSYWSNLLYAVFFLIGAIFFLFQSRAQAAALVIGVVLLFVSGLFIQSNKYLSMMRKTSDPISIHENGIKMNISSNERRRGLTDFVKKDDIESVNVMIYEFGKNWFINGYCRARGLMQIEIHIRDSTIYKTGIKSKETLSQIIEIASKRWNIRIEYD